MEYLHHNFNPFTREWVYIILGISLCFAWFLTELDKKTRIGHWLMWISYNTSLISKRSISPICIPAALNAAGIATVGTMPIIAGSHPTAAKILHRVKMKF